jgi:hypothetical protein
MHPQLRWFGVFLMGAIVFSPTDGSASTAQIAPLRDNTLYQQPSGTLSNGAGFFFFSGMSGAGTIRRGLLAFDVAGNIPGGSTITAVSLTLHLSQTQAGPQPVGLHRVTADWGEGSSHASGAEGGGAPATAGDATWIHRFYDTVLWSTAGGDFLAAPSATQNVADTTFYTWAGPGLVADVQQWLDDPASNHGWTVVGNELALSTAKRFDSRENPVPTVRPVLVVDYMPRVPGASALALLALGLGLGGGGVVLLRRRDVTARDRLKPWRG